MNIWTTQNGGAFQPPNNPAQLLAILFFFFLYFCQQPVLVLFLFLFLFLLLVVYATPLAIYNLAEKSIFGN